MTKLFENKVTLITGGSSGIGRATAIAFAKKGAKIVIAARREKESQAVISEINKLGAEGSYIHTDVANIADLKNMVKHTVNKFGRLDFAFNNAGVEEIPAPLSEKTEASYHQIMDINVKGVLFSMQLEIPIMLKNGGGVIVNTASVAGLVGLKQIPIYVASKHAVLGLTKSLALEFAKQNIRINAVSPGGVETDMYDRFVTGNPDIPRNLAGSHPIGRIAKPEEIANVVVWLCSSSASFITGQSINVDGGYITQ